MRVQKGVVNAAPWNLRVSNSTCSQASLISCVMSVMAACWMAAADGRSRWA